MTQEPCHRSGGVESRSAPGGDEARLRDLSAVVRFRYDGRSASRPRPLCNKSFNQSYSGNDL
jgi:hypothetical protein